MGAPLAMLDTLFWTCIGIGFLYSLISVLLGGIHSLADHGFGNDIGGGDVSGTGDMGDHAGGSHAHGDHGGDADHSEGLKSVLAFVSPLTVSFFLIGFGGFGLVATHTLGMSQVILALFSSFIVGVALSAGTFALFAKIFVHSQGSSHPTSLDLIGCKAEVITGIPESGIGAVSYVCRGSRFTAPAKSVSGEIPVGTLVRIRSAAGNTLQVERDEA